MRKWINIVEGADDVEYSVSHENGRIEVTATLRGRKVGVIDGGWSGLPPLRKFAASYMEVSAKHRNKGIGRGLLERFADLVPEEADRLYFFQVTSQGMLKLIEQVFGPVNDATPEGIDRLPAKMDSKSLRWARGINVWVPLKKNITEMQRPADNAALAAWLAPSRIKHLVYHGTRKPVEGKLKTTDGRLFFAEDPDAAGLFAGVGYDGEMDDKVGGGHVFPAYIRLVNPYVPTDPEEYCDYSRIEGRSEELRQQGYDGFICNSDGGEQFCVFSADQVWPATQIVRESARDLPTVVYHGTSEEQWAQDMGEHPEGLHVATSTALPIYDYAKGHASRGEKPILVSFRLDDLVAAGLTFEPNPNHAREGRAQTWKQSLVDHGVMVVRGFREEHKALGTVKKLTRREMR